MLLDSSKRYIFYDGAMGTMLQKNNLQAGERPDILNISSPEAVLNVHRLYVDAGSDIICTNTFGANRLALHGTAYSPKDIISAAVGLAKRAGGESVKTALDIGPLGVLLAPMGELEPLDAYELFKEQAIAGMNAGADCAAIETMSDIAELAAAVRAVTENTDLPVLATMTFDKTGRTYMGCSPEEFAETAKRLGVYAAGVNCSLEPAEMYDVAARIAKASGLPLIVKPNAGLPDGKTGGYAISPKEFAKQMSVFKKIDSKLIIGGCCGTTPEYISKLRKVFVNV